MRRPAPGGRQVVVLSANGGVGKTTLAAVLGDVFARYRMDAVVAVDASSRAGTLVERLIPKRATGAAVTDVLAAAQQLGTYGAIRQYVEEVRDSRLLVVASDPDPARSEALTSQDIHLLQRVMGTHFDVGIWDTCSGLQAPTQDGLLSIADQLVIVTTAAADRIRGTDRMLGRLVDLGHLELTRRAVMVVNAGGRALLSAAQAQIDRSFRGRCGVLVHMPYDRHLREGGVISMGALQPRTRQVALELTAAVAGQWPAQPKRRRDGR